MEEVIGSSPIKTTKTKSAIHWHFFIYIIVIKNITTPAKIKIIPPKISALYPYFSLIFLPNIAPNIDNKIVIEQISKHEKITIIVE